MQKECSVNVKEVLVDISHNIRQPVANIIGLVGVLDHVENSPEGLRKLLGYIKQATESLDFFTKDLTALVIKLERKLNK
jgi:signal transduction histidine kinase